MQISVAILPGTLFSRHTSDNVRLVRHGVDSFQVFNPYKNIPFKYHWIPLNTIEYHSVPLDHSMVFQHDSVVFPMVICNTIQYHWTIQWYFSRLNGTLGYSMVFLLNSMVLWMVIRNTIQDHWTIQWYILFSVVFSMVFQNTIEYHWTTQW